MEICEEDREGKGSGCLTNASKWLDMTLPNNKQWNTGLTISKESDLLYRSLSLKF